MGQKCMWDVKQVRRLKKLGEYHSGWRQRTVEVYAHPEDDMYVVTVGTPDAGDQPIVLIEEAEAYGRQLNGDWSDTK